MTWKKITQSFNEIIDILSKKTINGDEDLENMRCVYIKNDSDIVYVSNAFEFIDLDPSPNTIKKITLYQSFDHS